ncbi:uncharacterized protein LOC132166186 [Corylus avellana]|uniref:uncharacterized protein LOC132166186 n=1 Tax=Corylus avellana TaxID=13451 RepID=UPI00286D5DA0|nr:uncharacterized protein LOC132166186 [Corylus avellana]
MDSFREQPNMPIDILQKKVKAKWNVDVHVSSLYRARKRAREIIFGKLDEQYYRLWDYCSMVRSTNVGSCLILMVERPMPQVPCRFQRLYFSLTAMKNGFVEGCRPVVGLDACFLKGTYKGQMMAAVGRDANNNMYPIAIVVVEAETKDSWTWFLEALVTDLGPTRHGWTFISDRQKGLVPSLEQVCPQSEHRTCIRHLYANFRNSGHRGVLLKDLLWQAAASYTKQEFNRVMDDIKKMSKDAHAYLEKIDPNTWCRGWFNTTCKSGLLHNNTCESFNSWIKKYRDQTILSMLEAIRYKLMRRYVRKKELISSMEEALGPKIIKKLEKEEDEASNCWCTYAGQGMFEVECMGKKFVVDVDGRTCGCRKWDITGIPCSHGISTILHQGGDPAEYLSDYYGKEKYYKSYDYTVFPVPSEDQWPISN